MDARLLDLASIVTMQLRLIGGLRPDRPVEESGCAEALVFQNGMVARMAAPQIRGRRRVFMMVGIEVSVGPAWTDHGLA